MTKQGSILVIRGGAIGDFILTLPAIAALRRQFPAANLEILGYPHIAQLALAGGLVNALRPIEAQALAGFFARGGELAEGLVDYFSDFDLIISYLYDPDAIFQDNVARCTPAQFIVGPHRALDAQGDHATKVYLKPLERLAIFDPDPIPRLSFVPAERRVSEPESSSPLALHPGSGSERKNWPEAKWAELLARLIEISSMSLLLVGGEAEGDRLSRLAAGLPSDRVRVAQSLALSDLGRRLARCRGFVGHDSGISHLAAAVGLRTLVMWGETALQVWRPPSDNVVVIQHPDGLEHLPVETVVEQIGRL